MTRQRTDWHEWLLSMVPVGIVTILSLVAAIIVFGMLGLLS